MGKVENLPLAKRSGQLKNGNPSGDPSKAPRCGAHSKRSGNPCKAPAMSNGRCRMHGGRSTGAKTENGKNRSRNANFRNGEYTAERMQEKKRMKELMSEFQSLLKSIEPEGE